jgi:D-methionine transport system ATP-binding protein
MRERDNVVIYAYKPFCFSRSGKVFLLFECGGHSNNKVSSSDRLHALKIKKCGVDLNKIGVIHHDFIRECKENI